MSTISKARHMAVSHKAPRKKLTVKEMSVKYAEMKSRNAYLETQNVMLTLDIEERVRWFMDSIYLYEKIMDACLKDAGTIGEARRWFADYKAAMNAVDLEKEDPRGQMLRYLNEAGFEITEADIPSHEGHINETFYS